MTPFVLHWAWPLPRPSFGSNVDGRLATFLTDHPKRVNHTNSKCTFSYLPVIQFQYMLKSIFSSIAVLFASIFGGHQVQSVSVAVPTQPQFQKERITAPPQTVTSNWIAFSSLPPAPVKTQIYRATRYPSITVFNYDGSIPTSELVSTADPNYPDINTIKLTAFLHSQLRVVFPASADISTLLVSITGKFLKDRSNVYYLDCEGFVCGYNLLSGADPVTFAEMSTSTVDHTEVVNAKDKNHAYQCTSVECMILPTSH